MLTRRVCRVLCLKAFDGLVRGLRVSSLANLVPMETEVLPREGTSVTIAGLHCGLGLF